MVSASAARPRPCLTRRPWGAGSPVERTSICPNTNCSKQTLLWIVGYRADEAESSRLNLARAIIVQEELAMAQQRKRIKHKTTFEERLAEEARRFKEAAEEQPAGSTARELLLRRARQAETASRMNEWLSSPEPASPK
jgi:hypothetical protein